MAGKKGTLTVRIVSDTKPLEDGLDDGLGKAEKKMKLFADKGSAVMKAGAAAGGLAAGAALTSAFFTGLDQKATTARLGAALDLPKGEAEKLGKTAGKLYSEGFGESFDDVAGAIESVVSTIGKELDPDDIEPMTEKAMNLATAFEVDVGEAVSAVGYLIRTGLAKDATEAFDLITVALQKVPREMRGEALEALSEYGGAFAALGFEGEEAIRLILDAAGDTSVGVDKVGDAVKEFLIRSTDGSTATREAMQGIGLDADETARKILEGGPAAEEAFGKIIEALLSVEDPAARAQWAVALFGTPIEDLNVNKIPAFLTALQGAKGGLDDVQGSADDLGESLENNATKVEAFKRRMEQSLVNFVAEDVIPALEDLDENFGLTMELVGFHTEKAADRAVDALGRIRDGFSGPIDGALDLLELLGRLGGGKVVNAAADAIGVKESDIKFLPPTEWNYGTNTPTSAPEKVFGTGPVRFRAKGGPVSARTPYLVGEEGPEMFVPNGSGSIIDNRRTQLMEPQSAVVHNNTFNITEAQHLDGPALAAHFAWFLGRR